MIQIKNILNAITRINTYTYKQIMDKLNTTPSNSDIFSKNLADMLSANRSNVTLKSVETLRERFSTPILINNDSDLFNDDYYLHEEDND